MTRISQIVRDYRESGAFHSLVSIHVAIDPHTFMTKGGDLVILLKAIGIDDECFEPEQISQIAHRLEAAQRLFDENFRVYQYLIKSDSKPIEAQVVGSPVVQEALLSRSNYLNSKALHGIELYWAVVYEGCRFTTSGNRISSLFKQPVKTIQSLLSTGKTISGLEGELERASQVLSQRVTSLIVQLEDVVPLKLLDKNEAFLVLRRLLNFAPHKAEGPGLSCDDLIDFQLCDSALECHRDHLMLDDDYVKVLTLRESPPHTTPHLFRNIEEIAGHFIIATEWRRESNAAMRSRIKSDQRHWHNSKFSPVSYLGKESPRSGEILVDESARAMVADLGEALRTLETSPSGFGEFSTTIVVYDRDLAVVRHASAECYKVFAAHGAHVTEERYNLLNAFLSIVPGNSAFNLRRLWLSGANSADLSLVFAPAGGERRNSFLNTEYVGALETRQGTPYFLNLHHGDVGHGLVLGSIGAGKSFFLAFLITQLQKYLPYTFVFDLGGSYKSLTSLLGGSYLHIGPEAKGISINPFCLPPTKENLQFLFSFVRVLVESSGYQLNTQDERDLYAQIQNLYEIEPSQRRLGTLAKILNRSLGDALGKWVGSGQYGGIFDNAEDNLTFARFQAFDFEGMDKYPELLEPLLFYILHRASVAVQDPANATMLKIFLVDEAWRFFANSVIRSYITEALKTWRKRNAAMILATQSSDDLLRSEMLQTVAESCPTKFFLANPGMDPEAYSQVFHLNRVETDIIRSLIPKREMLLKRPDGSKVLALNVDPKSYWLYTNDPYDNQRKQESFDRHGLQKGLEILSKEKTP